MESGLILLDKPTGLTSHDCVTEIRKLCPKWMKVGHGGTLDPFSTGLLIILVGKATRLASFFQGMDKVYEGIFKFGVSTDTFDVDGNISVEGALPDFQNINLEEIANSFIGHMQQIPPSFSAKRIGKKRAYDLARQGKAVSLEPVNITIYSFSLEYIAEDRLKFWLKCSSGTYVRAIARDLGEKLNSPCHCLALVRKSVGKFDLLNSNTLDDPFNQKGFIPFDKIDLSISIARVDYREEKLILNGQDITASREIQENSGWVKFVNPKEKFIGLGKIDGRIIHPSIVFPEKV